MDVQRFLPQSRYTITYNYVHNTIKIPAQTLTGVAIYMVSSREIMRSNGVYLNNDQRFSLKASALTNPGNVRDIITWNGKDYRIIDTDNHLVYDQLAGTMRNLKLAYDLTDVIDLWRNVNTGDTAGRTVGLPTLLAANLICKGQPMDQGEIQQFGVTQLEKRYNYIVETEYDLLQSDQLRTQDGRILEVDRQLDKQCLDLLSRIECVDRGARWQ